MRRPLSLLVPLLLIAAVTACGDDDAPSESAPDSQQVGDSVSTETTTGADKEPAMFDFVADDVRGGEVVGAEYAGRDVVVWFWAPWCTNCNREAPDVADLVAERGGEIAILGMSGLAEVRDMEAFVQRHGLEGMPHAIDPDGAIWEGFGVSSQSVFVFVNDDGSVSHTEFGVQGRDALDAAIDDLLAD